MAQLASPVTPLLPSQIEPKAQVLTVQPPSSPVPASQRDYWLLPAGGRGDKQAPERLRAWLDSGMWGLHGKTQHRKGVKADDYACFYLPVGVVATARIAGAANEVLAPAGLPWPTDNVRPIYRVPLSQVQWLV